MPDFLIDAKVNLDLSQPLQGIQKLRAELAGLAEQGRPTADQARALTGPATASTAINRQIAQQGGLSPQQQEAQARLVGLSAAARQATGASVADVSKTIKTQAAEFAKGFSFATDAARKQFETEFSASAKAFSTEYSKVLETPLDNGQQRNVARFAADESRRITRELPTPISDLDYRRARDSANRVQNVGVEAAKAASEYADLNRRLGSSEISQAEYDRAITEVARKARAFGLKLDRQIATGDPDNPVTTRPRIPQAAYDRRDELRAQRDQGAEVSRVQDRVEREAGARYATQQQEKAAKAAAEQAEAAQRSARGQRETTESLQKSWNQQVASEEAAAKVYADEEAARKQRDAQRQKELNNRDAAIRKNLAVQSAGEARIAKTNEQLDKEQQKRVQAEKSRSRKEEELGRKAVEKEARREQAFVSEVKPDKTAAQKLADSRAERAAAYTGLAGDKQYLGRYAEATAQEFEAQQKIALASWRLIAERSASIAENAAEAAVLQELYADRLAANVARLQEANQPVNGQRPIDSKAEAGALRKEVRAAVGAQEGRLLNDQLVLGESYLPEAQAQKDLSRRLVTALNSGLLTEELKNKVKAAQLGDENALLQLTEGTEALKLQLNRLYAEQLSFATRSLSGEINLDSAQARKEAEILGLLDTEGTLNREKIALLQAEVQAQARERTARATVRSFGQTDTTPGAARVEKVEERATAASQVVGDRSLLDREASAAAQAFEDNARVAAATWLVITENLSAIAQDTAEAAVYQEEFKQRTRRAALRAELSTPEIIDSKARTQVLDDEARARGREQVANSNVQRIEAEQSSLISAKVAASRQAEIVKALSTGLVTQEAINAILVQGLTQEEETLLVGQLRKTALTEAAALYSAQKALVANSLANNTAISVEEAELVGLTDAQGNLNREKIAIISQELTTAANALRAENQIRSDTQVIAGLKKTEKELAAERVRQLAASSGRGGGGRIPPDDSYALFGGGGLFGGKGAAGGGGGINFARGAASSLQYGLPSIALFGGGRALLDAAREANELEVEFSIIENQLDSIGESNAFDNLTNSVLEAARATGQSSIEFARLESQFIGAFSALNERDNPNLTGGDFGQFIDEQLRAAAELAEVSGLPLEEITDGLTAASIAFDTDVREIGDIATAVFNETGVQVKELVGFIGDIAPVANEAGFSLEQIISLAGVVQQRSGRSGTTLAEQYIRILPAVTQNKEALFELGAQYEQLGSQQYFAALAAGDVVQLFEEIGRVFPDLDEGARDALFQQLGSRREAGSLVPLLENYGQFEELVGAVADSTGELEERFENVRKTLGNTLGRLAETLKQLFIELYEAGISDALLGAAFVLEEIVGLVTPLADLLRTVNDLTGGFAAKLAGIALTMKLLNTLWQKMVASQVVSNALAASQFRRGYTPATNPTFPGPVATGRIAPTQPTGRLPQTALTTSRARLAAGGAAGLGRGALAFLGGGSVALGGVTAGLTAGVLAFNKIKGYADSWQEEVEALREASPEKSVEELRAEAETLEDTGAADPGVWAEIGAFITGRDLVTKAEALRTDAITKAQAETLDLIDNTKSLDAFEEFGDLYLEGVLAGLGGSDIGGRQVGGGRDVNRGTLLDIIEKDGFNAARLEAQEFDAISGRFDFANTKFLDSVSILATQLGIAQDDFSQDLLDVLQGQGSITENIANEIEELQESGANPELLAVLLSVYEGLSEAALENPDSAAGEAITIALTNVQRESGKLAQDAESAKLQYELGLISFSEYYAVLEENSNRLAEAAAAAPDDVTAQMASMRGAAETLEVLSNRRVANLERFLNRFDLANDTQDPASIDRMIERVERELKDADSLTREDFENLITSYYDLQKDLREARANLADTEEEADAIRQEDIEIDPAIIARQVENSLENYLGDLDKFIEKWNELSENTKTSFTALSEDFFTRITLGIATGGVSLEQARTILQAAQNQLKESLKQNQRELFGLVASFQLFNTAAKEALVTAIKAEAEILAILQESEAAIDEVPTTIYGDQPDSDAKNKATKYEIEKGRIALRKALTNGTDLQNAFFDLAAAEQDILEARANGNEADVLNAQAAKQEVLNEIADLQKEEAGEIRRIAGRINKAIGNSVEAANDELAAAYEEYGAAIQEFGAGSPEAEESRASLVEAMVGVRDALQDRAELFVAVVARQLNVENDPVVTSEAEVKLAEQQLRQAIGIDERLEAQKRLLDANADYQKAIQEVRISQFELRQAELESVEDEIGAANLAVQITKQQLADAQARGAGAAEINSLRAQVISAQKAAHDTRISELREQYDFLYDMEELNRTQYIQQLEYLQSLAGEGTAAFRDLARAIKQLKDDLSGDLQTNLPDVLDLPTFYEVRRLSQTAGSSPGGQSSIGYQDNRNMNVNVYVDNGMDESQAVAVISEAIGLGRNGSGPRIY